MWSIPDGRLFFRRHPLFVAALVAAACVLAAQWHAAAGFAVALLFGTVGARWLGGRTGLAWALCGLIAVGTFTARHAVRNADERSLLANAGGAMAGRVLKDAKGSESFWQAPVILADGSKVWWEGRGGMPVTGSRVRGNGNFGPLQGARNPGEFDQAEWLRGQGVAAIFHARWLDGEVMTGKWPALGAAIRRGFRTAVTAGLAADSEEAVVIRAVVIGEQPPDAEELIAAFRNSGTLHAFSVSGLHVSMVGLIAWAVLRCFGVRRRWSIPILLVLIFGYSWLTGNSAPAVRSAWMAAVFLGAFVVRRRPDLLNALGAVLLAAMLWDGRLLFQPGVQLSYGVVAAIAIGAGWGTRLFSGISRPELYLPTTLMSWRQRQWLGFRRWIAQSLGVSLVAAVGSTPFTAFHFGLVTPISVFAGIIFLPLVFVLLCAALLGAALHGVWPSAAGVVNRLNGSVANGCVLTARSFAAIPGGHFQLKQDHSPFLLIYDLEHGAAAAVFSAGDAAVLLDCGDRYGFRRRVVPSLRRLGVVPDAAVLSHPDGGHLGGGNSVWETFPIRQALLPVERSRSPAFRAWVREAPGAGVRLFHAGNQAELPMPDGARWEILHAPEPRSQNGRADDRVVISRLHWRGWKVLFTSDSGLGTELELLDAGRDISADVIIAGRHEGDATLCDKFLDAVNPQAIVASHSDFPPEEVLKPETVAYWRSRAIQVVHQGQAGGVTLRVDDAGNLRLEGFADKSVTILKRR